MRTTVVALATRGASVPAALRCVTVSSAAAAASLSLIAVAGCSAGHRPAAATNPSANPAVTATAPAPPASSAPASSQSSPAADAPTTQAPPPGPAPCPTRSLRLAMGIAQGTAGSTYTVIDFTNISSITCTLYGYPGVAFTSGRPGHQIGLAATEDTATPRELVTLAPGAVAHAQLRIVHAANLDPAACQPVTAPYLQVYPPNQATRVFLGFPTATCSTRVPILTIGAVRPGAGG